jgi:amino acid transporter
MIGREQGFLPPRFQKLNAQGIQVNILVAQGIVTSIIACLYAFIPDVSSAYWIFSVMTTQVYLIVYVLMFITAVKLRRDKPDHPRGFKAPMLGVLCTVGFLSTVAAFLIGFVPPSQFSGGSTLTYVLIIGGGVGIIGLLAPFAMYAARKPSWKTAEPAPFEQGAAK